VDYLRAAGFEVEARDTSDMAAIKRRFGVPDAAQSCHTGSIDGYVIEGHVPADVIRRLLRERPQVLGVSAPGMPQGAPGMDAENAPPYEIVAFLRDGRTQTLERRSSKP
jgi:hypothetical protein